MNTQPFMFDTEKFAELFKTDELTKIFDQAKANFNAEALVEAQKKNLSALLEANKIAAAGYQDIFKRQVAMYEETISTLQSAVAELGEGGLSVEGQTKQVELAKSAFEKAVANLTELAETAKKANEGAFEVVATRVRESVEELKAASK